jgi:hypothetical protein
MAIPIACPDTPVILSTVSIYLSNLALNSMPDGCLKVMGGRLPLPWLQLSIGKLASRYVEAIEKLVPIKGTVLGLL